MNRNNYRCYKIKFGTFISFGKFIIFVNTGLFSSRLILHYFLLPEFKFEAKLQKFFNRLASQCIRLNVSQPEFRRRLQKVLEKSFKGSAKIEVQWKPLTVIIDNQLCDQFAKLYILNNF